MRIAAHCTLSLLNASQEMIWHVHFYIAIIGGCCCFFCSGCSVCMCALKTIKAACHDYRVHVQCAELLAYPPVILIRLKNMFHLLNSASKVMVATFHELGIYHTKWQIMKPSWAYITHARASQYAFMSCMLHNRLLVPYIIYIFMHPMYLLHRVCSSVHCSCLIMSEFIFPDGLLSKVHSFLQNIHRLPHSCSFITWLLGASNETAFTFN